jgi:hypothetical protein
LEAGDHWLGFAVGDLSTFTAGEMFVKRVLDEDPTTEGAGGNGIAWKFGTSVDANGIPGATTAYFSDFGSTTRKGPIDETPAVDLTEYHVYSEYSAAGDWGNMLNGAELHQTATNTVGFSAAATFGRDTGGGLLGNVTALVIFDEKAATDDRTYLHQNL